MAGTAKKSLINRIISIFGTAIFVIVTIAVIYLFVRIMTGRKAEIFGYRFYVVVTDSMTPELEVGAVILSKSVTPKDLQVGENITFLGTVGNQKGLLITHKIIEAPYYDDNGKGFVITQGVKQNSVPDSPVAFENIKAVMIKKMPILSFFYSLIKKPIGFIMIIIIPLIALTVYQLFKIAAYNAKKENNEKRNSD